jgi:hypothetical protein
LEIPVSGFCLSFKTMHATMPWVGLQIKSGCKLQASVNHLSVCVWMCWYVR